MTGKRGERAWRGRLGPSSRTLRCRASSFGFPPRTWIRALHQRRNLIERDEERGERAREGAKTSWAKQHGPHAIAFEPYLNRQSHVRDPPSFVDLDDCVHADAHGRPNLFRRRIREPLRAREDEERARSMVSVAGGPNEPRCLPKGSARKPCNALPLRAGKNTTKRKSRRRSLQSAKGGPFMG